MIIDSHAHVILPPQRQIDSMDEAGIDMTILFPTSVHPERAVNMKSLDLEMQALSRTLAGNARPLEAQLLSLEEQMDVIKAYPERFRGFGRVPLQMSLEETVQWIEGKVKGVGFLGLGEFTLAPGEASNLEVVFEASAHLGNLPLWIHTFHPLGLEDIQEINALSRSFQGVPVILGHLGGTSWIQAIHLAGDNPRLYLDLSAAFTIIAPTMAIRELPDRTLFSSDAPYGDPYLVKKMVERITPDKFVRERVLGENIAEMLNL